MLPVIVSRPNKALVIPRTAGTMRLFPEGKPLDDKRWVIRHGLAEHRLLTLLGFKVMNPLLCYYDWPGGTPYSVQKITADMLTKNPRGYVLNGMGTGKTRATLWAWDYLYGEGYCKKLLVVAPLSTLELVWGSEAFAILPHRKVQILHGAKKKRLERLADPEADIYVINHDGIKVLAAELEKRTDIDCMVIDEITNAYRNLSDRAKFMAKFAAKFQFAWGLTGAPMPNEPTDVWMQCRIITPHTVPKHRTHAKSMLMDQKGEYLWTPKKDAVERAFSWMQPAVRFALDDVVELPEVVERYIDVPLTPQQTKIYKAIANEFTTQIGTDTITAINAGAAVNKLLQISGGYVYSTAQGTIKLDSDPRKQVLLDLIRANERKVIVFCPFRHMVEGLAEVLRATGPKDPDYIDHAVIHGDIDPGSRNMIFDAFQNSPEIKVILAHPGCMAHGLTLTAADTIIWYCPFPNLEIVDQANARITRIGQKHRQQVIHLQSTPIEKKIYALLRRKARVQDMLLALFEDATTAATGGATPETTNAPTI